MRCIRYTFHSQAIILEKKCLWEWEENQWFPFCQSYQTDLDENSGILLRIQSRIWCRRMYYHYHFWWKGTRIAGGIRKIDIYLAFDVWFDFSAMICVAFRAYSFMYFIDDNTIVGFRKKNHLNFYFQKWHRYPMQKLLRVLVKIHEHVLP